MDNNWKICQIAVVKKLGQMAYPKVTPAHWSVWRYDSYTLHPNGSLVRTIHSPGFAFEVNDTQHLSAMDNLLFLSSRYQRCAGSWFVCASLPHPYTCMTSGQNLLCELILLMGARSITLSLHDSHMHLYFYSV